MKVLDNNLKITQAPDPEPKGGEVLVRVHAAGVNHADLLQREGKYPPPPGASKILGLEASGTIEKLGVGASRFMQGDRVMCLLSGGGYAEKVTVPEAQCIPIPHNLSFEEAASIPETFLTAYQSLFLIGEIQPEQWVLIHAGGSGVGTAAIQLARQMDAKTIATSRSKEKLEKCLSLGADVVINAESGSFAKKILEATDGHGADLILDFVGAPYFAENMESLSIGGCIIFLATMGGGKLEAFDLRGLMKKWATLTGSSLRNRSPIYKGKLIEEFSKFALAHFESGMLKPIIHATFPWEKAEEAHRLLAQNQAFGKIVLSVYSVGA